MEALGAADVDVWMLLCRKAAQLKLLLLEPTDKHWLSARKLALRPPKIHQLQLRARRKKFFSNPRKSPNRRRRSAPCLAQWTRDALTPKKKSAGNLSKNSISDRTNGAPAMHRRAQSARWPSPSVKDIIHQSLQTLERCFLKVTRMERSIETSSNGPFPSIGSARTQTLPL